MEETMRKNWQALSVLAASMIALAACAEKPKCMSCNLPTAPTQPPVASGPIVCSIRLGATAQSFGYLGGSNTFGVSKSDENGTNCPWSPRPACSWVRATGTGAPSSSGGVSYTVDRNDGGSRICIIEGFGGPVFTITQDGAPPAPPVVIVTPGPGPGPNPNPGPGPTNPTPTCNVAVDPGRTISWQSHVGSTSFQVSSGCAWTASYDGVFAGPTSGTGGSHTVNHAIPENPSTSPRSFSYTVNGRTVTFTQSGRP